MTGSTADAGCRVGIDVGGTFTDFVLADGRTGQLTRYKEPSVPEDPSRSVERGLPALIEAAGVSPADISLIVHGTTLALNAIIQRRGARLGLVVSRGNRGVLEIGRAQLPNAFSFALQKEEPLVPRRLVLATEARLLRSGAVHALPASGEFEAMAETFRAGQVEAVTVMLLHAYANPEFEQDVAARLAALLPGVPVSASARIWPEQREFERALVALMNAYIQPLMERYLDRLQDRVRGLGIAAPICITANNGGSLSLATARARPIETILSGPATGVVAASIIARPTGHDHFIAVDMGGTSADLCVVEAGEPERTTRTHVGGFPVIVPAVNVSAIGAGGGSIVRVDSHGVLKVGPDSAGASPGPACYARGGTEATVTDCYLVAGMIDAGNFLGGRMRLDRMAADAALQEVAARLGLVGPDRAVRAAAAALQVTTALMATEIAKAVAQRGENIRDYALVPYGGAGPTQAALIARECGIATIIVPAAPSTFCALGAILTDVKRDYVQTRHIALDAPDAARALDATLRRLETEARGWIDAEGALLGSTDFERSADMRYAGQAYDLPVPIDPVLRDALDVAGLAELFHQAHEHAYTFRDPNAAIEITTVRLRAVGKLPDLQLPVVAKANAAPLPAGRRRFHDGEDHDAAVYPRSALGEGSRIEGPAIVEQDDTTILVLPGWQGRVDQAGNLILRRPA